MQSEFFLLFLKNIYVFIPKLCLQCQFGIQAINFVTLTSRTIKTHSHYSSSKILMLTCAKNKLHETKRVDLIKGCALSSLSISKAKCNETSNLNSKMTFNPYFSLFLLKRNNLPSPKLLESSFF